MIETSVKSNSKLPNIEHPIVKQAKANALSIGSVDNGPLIFDKNNEQAQRPVGFEEGGVRYKVRSGTKHKSSRSSLSSSREFENNDGFFMTNIPENIEYTTGEPNSTRLPIFGNRSNVQSRASVVSSRCSSVASSASTMKVSPDEVSNRFHKKLQNNYYEVRKRFLDNDPEQKGNVTREALMRIFQSITGLPVSKSTLNAILEFWGVRIDKQVFSFTEINSVFFNKNRRSSDDSFVDPVARQKTNTLEIVKMKSAEVFKWIKMKLESRELYLTDLFPEVDSDPESLITESSLKSALNKQMIDLTQDELTKLWNKFDPKNTNNVTGLTFMKQLGILNQPKKPTSVKIVDPKNEITSTSSLETILRNKLREGYKLLGQEFQKLDKTGKGFVSPDNFLKILNNHGLQLDKSNLQSFLSRCLISATKDQIPYTDFLARFQDRSEAGITHRLLVSDEKPSSDSLQLAEKKLVNIFQKDFLEILNGFRQHDKSQLGVIPIKDFKDVIEQKLNTKFTEQELKMIIDNLPLSRDPSQVLYLDFLKQFDTGINTATSPIINSNKTVEISQNNATSRSDNENSAKSISDTKRIMKSCFENQFNELEMVFEEIDELNTNQFTEEMMYQLFKKLGTEITRGDIRAVWPTFLLNDRKMLDYKEFLRHFMYNKLTASYPNSKLVPPVKGDSDLIKRSKKLNGTTDLILDNLRSKIQIMHKSLQNEFEEMDKSGSGEISLEQFKEILKELSIEINEVEIDTVCQKFSTKSCNNTKRINYVALLYPHGVHDVGEEKGIRRKSKNSKKIKEENNQTLQEKLKALEKPSVKRALKKADSDGTGFVQLEELRAMLLIEGVSLSEDDCMEILAQFDKTLSGNVNYKAMRS